MTLATPPLARSLFDLGSDVVWIMHCAEGPVTRAAADAVAQVMQRELQPWTMRWNEEFVGLPSAVRREAAKLMVVQEQDVSLVGTTGSGLSTIAQGFDWREGDEVLAPLGEFPSNAWPWLALRQRGVVFREVPLWDGHRAGSAALASTPPPSDVDPETCLVNALSPRTRLVTTSWVRFQDGLALDLGRLGAALAHRGVPLICDGIQGVGTRRCHLDGVSAMACGGHKALLAPQGLGVLWTDPEFRAQLTPPGGWLAVEGATDFTRPGTDFVRAFRRDGQALEVGVPNLVGAAALQASLTLINESGIDAISAHIDRLQLGVVEALRGHEIWSDEAQRLSALHRRGRLGAILALHHGGRGDAWLQAMLRDGFRRQIFASVREGYLRVAWHGWHDSNDLARVIEWLRSAR